MGGDTIRYNVMFVCFVLFVCWYAWIIGHEKKKIKSSADKAFFVENDVNIGSEKNKNCNVTAGQHLDKQK